MKRTLTAVLTSALLVTGAVAAAAPASAASTGGYKVCSSGQKVGVKVTGSGGSVTINVPGRSTSTYLPSGVVTYVTGTQQVGTWTVNGSFRSASAICR